MSDPKGSSRTATLLGGHRQPRQRQPRREPDQPGHRTELGPHPMIRDFEAGPFPHQAVAPFPPEAVELLERRTGQRFPAQLLAEWERIRAFLGYEAFELTPPLVAAQRLEDFRERGPAVEAEPPERARHLAARSPIARPEVPAAFGMPDPDDLGD